MTGYEMSFYNRMSSRQLEIQCQLKQNKSKQNTVLSTKNV